MLWTRPLPSPQPRRRQAWHYDGQTRYGFQQWASPPQGWSDQFPVRPHRRNHAWNQSRNGYGGHPVPTPEPVRHLPLRVTEREPVPKKPEPIRCLEPVKKPNTPAPVEPANPRKIGPLTKDVRWMPENPSYWVDEWYARQVCAEVMERAGPGPPDWKQWVIDEQRQKRQNKVTTGTTMGTCPQDESKDLNLFPIESQTSDDSGAGPPQSLPVQPSMECQVAEIVNAPSSSETSSEPDSDSSGPEADAGTPVGFTLSALREAQAADGNIRTS